MEITRDNLVQLYRKPERKKKREDVIRTSAQIAKDVEDFIKNKGVIKIIPEGVSGFIDASGNLIKGYGRQEQ